MESPLSFLPYLPAFGNPATFSIPDSNTGNELGIDKSGWNNGLMGG